MLPPISHSGRAPITLNLDVRESADGVLYVMHDETLNRTTNGTGPIGHMLSSEIDTLDAGSWFGATFTGAVVPRLDAYLEHLPRPRRRLSRAEIL